MTNGRLGLEVVRILEAAGESLRQQGASVPLEAWRNGTTATDLATAMARHVNGNGNGNGQWQRHGAQYAGPARKMVCRMSAQRAALSAHRSGRQSWASGSRYSRSPIFTGARLATT